MDDFLKERVEYFLEKACEVCDAITGKENKSCLSCDEYNINASDLFYEFKQFSGINSICPELFYNFLFEKKGIIKTKKLYKSNFYLIGIRLKNGGFNDIELLKDFIKEKCDEDGNLIVRSSDLFLSWKIWLKNKYPFKEWEHEYQFAHRWFTPKIVKLGYRRKRIGVAKVTSFIGLSLKALKNKSSIFNE